MASLEKLQLNQSLYRDLAQVNSSLPGVESLDFLNQLESNANVKVETASETIISGEIAGNLVMIDGFIRSKNFITGSSGWTINTDGTVEFNDGVFRGSLLATSINIPDTTTNNSFHTDSNGNSWWGANLADGYAGANSYILNTGTAKFNNIIVNNSELTFQNNLGDGSDGAVTISADTSLTRDMFYTNLTIDAGKTLSPSGFRIFCTGTLTNNGIISNLGNNGSNGVGITGGAGGVASAEGSLPGPIAGVDGGDGGAPVWGSSVGNVGTNGGAGTSVAKSFGNAVVAGSDGGSGGSCNFAGGGGGSGGALGAVTGTIFNTPKNFTSAYLLVDFRPTTTVFEIAATAGGAAGGGSGGADQATYISGAGGGGGGAGGNGGMVWIASKIIVNNGAINVTGGNGGNGGNGGKGWGGLNGGAGGGGGGAGGSGGNGGVIFLIYSSYTNTGTLNIDAGVAGTGGAKGTGTQTPAYDGTAGDDGTAGNVGKIIQLQI